MLTPSTVLITGGSGGIGSAVAHASLECGYWVINLDRTEPRQQQLISSPRFTTLIVDVNRRSEFRKALARIPEQFPSVVGLVSCAGSRPSLSTFEDLTEEDWLGTFRSHLGGLIVAAQEASQLMNSSQGGAIVHVSSVTAYQPGRAFDYSAAKAGVVNLTQSLAAEFINKNIRVNAVAPGWTDTDFLKKPGRDLSQLKSVLPGGKFLQPADIAKVILFLLSEQAVSVNGSVICCDGGYSSLAGLRAYA